MIIINSFAGSSYIQQYLPEKTSIEEQCTSVLSNDQNKSTITKINENESSCFQEEEINKEEDSYKYICDACGETFLSNSLLEMDHMLIPVICKTCERKSSNYGRYIADKQKSNQLNIEQSLICDQCGKSFTNKSSFLRHIRFHNGDETQNCNICEEAFKNLIEHNYIHTGVKPYMCKICGERFALCKLFNVHRKGHSSEQSHIRNNKSFKSKTNKQKIHLNMAEKILDTRKRPYKCNICNKDFVNYRGLHDHVRHYHKSEESNVTTNIDHLNSERVSKYICGQCDKTFKNKSSFLRHERYHLGNVLENCNICEQAFYDLKGHEDVVHGGKKPFMCDICGKRWSQLTLLREHKRVHSDERPYKCDLCDKTYKCLSILYRHKKRHTGKDIIVAPILLLRVELMFL